MNKLYLILLTVLTVLSCASVEKNKQEETFKTSEKTLEENKDLTEIMSYSKTKSESNSINEIINFSIIPQNGLPAVFNFNYGGKLISGSTTGSINFSNHKAETKTRTISKTYTIIKKYRYWFKITEKQIIYRIRKKTKVITVDYPWYFWVILIPFIIIAWEVLKRYLPINFLKFLKVKTS